MDDLRFGLEVTVLGMGLVFGLLALLWLLMAAAGRLDARSATGAGGRSVAALPPGAAREPGVVRIERSGAAVAGEEDVEGAATLDPRLVAAITVAVLRHAETRWLQAAPAMRSYWPGSLLFASRWVAAGRTRQGQSWRSRR